LNQFYASSAPEDETIGTKSSFKYDYKTGEVIQKARIKTQDLEPDLDTQILDDILVSKLKYRSSSSSSSSSLNYDSIPSTSRRGNQDALAPNPQFQTRYRGDFNSRSKKGRDRGNYGDRGRGAT